MKMFLKKMEALIMASTYAQAGAHSAAMECLEAVYTPKPRQDKRPARKKSQQRRLRL
ncbi:MAG: hypothetical protein ACLFT5_01120 [Desulfovermiculus sp.]